jgi:hypothetical protein
VAAVTERQITRLARPFPSHVVRTNPSGGGSYVAHPVVEQRLIHDLGYPPDTTVAHILRGFVYGKAPNPEGRSKRAKDGTPDLPDVIVGVVLRMTVNIDGERVVVEEAGDCEDPHNWDTDGARLKDAMSDAYKRCAMRLGVGLHLWADKDFHLYEALKKQEELTPGEAS